MTRPDAIFIMGPTASGKTDLAMQLYDAMPSRLISVDSALVYRGLNIGSAKPEPEELARYPHDLIDICEPDDPYSASRFREDALAIIDKSIEENRVPILVGGTMLYFKTLVQGIADLPSADEAIRAEINRVADQSGWPELHKELATFDPVSAERIKPGDSQRIQRAIEVYRISGKTLTEYFQEQEETALNLNVKSIAIAPQNRDVLRTRIRKRFEQMLADGLVDEVRYLLEQQHYSPELPALKSVGYRQVIEYLSGEYDYDMMIEKAVTATSRLAKRQMTWLRSWPEVYWLESGDETNLQKLVTVLSSY